MNFALFNCRSICNKTAGVMQLLEDFDTDICCATETWLRKDDNAKFSEMKELGYSIHSQPRAGRGGGVAVLYKKSLKVTPQKCKRFKTFESCECTFKSSSGDILRIVSIYRSGTSTSQSANIPQFLTDFEQLLVDLVDKPGKPLIMGDFNIHIEDENDSVAQRFNSLLKSCGWVQQISAATHRDGGILDLVITRDGSFTHDCIEVLDPVITDSGTSSDHYFVAFNCNVSPAPIGTLEPITYRNIACIDLDAFVEDILKSKLCDTDCFNDLDSAVDIYESELSSILDKHAKEKTFIPRKDHNAEWWSTHCQQAKAMRRKIERLYQKNPDCPDTKRLYRKASERASSVIVSTRDHFYKTRLQDSAGDAKKTYSIVNKLLNKEKVSTATPSCSSNLESANNFAQFFKSKVDNIYSNIYLEQQSQDSPNSDEFVALSNSPKMVQFRHVSDEELVSIIKNMSNKFCDLDPIPTKILIKCLPELLPLISFIVNESLVKGEFPIKLKEALIRPSLKKRGLDGESLSNYRPISNLSFLSKIIEKCVSIQLTSYLEDNNLLSKVQSGYRKFHSCETATTRIHNDILITIDKKTKVVLLLLDLSAAFDTVSHPRLIKKLSSAYGITGIALTWIRSYLANRSFCVKVKDSSSSSTVLEIGVPQGSILGPLLFILYTKDLENIASMHGCCIHLYADDTQLYFTLDSDDPSQLEHSMEHCMSDIKKWMTNNFLQLNSSKTEVIVISSKFDSKNIPASLQIVKDQEAHVVSGTVKSLGLYLDSYLSMSDQITSVVQACNIQIRNLWFIASKLSFNLKIQLVHALVLSRIDYCNSVYFGLSSYDLSRLQKVQNSAVRFIFGRGRKAHTTPLLKKVHFLPVRFRINFKIALLAYKCLNNIAPPYLKELISPRQQSFKNVRLDNDYFYLSFPPSPNYVNTEKAFSHCAVKVFNSLPYDIRSAESVTSFKTKLKTYFFSLAFD